MTFFFNAERNAFYHSDINDIPNGSIKITNELHSELLQKQSDGLIIQSDENGYPIAVERVLTDEERIYTNESRKQQLINEAIQKIALLQDIIDLDMQESNEGEQLKQWKKYRILLTRVDVSSFDIQWPENPENRESK